jgi:hypothetical protein
MSASIKEAGHAVVIEYEAKNGRIATLHEKDGYDLISIGPDGTRHIEVKSTSKDRFQWRWLTEDQFKAVVKDPLFFLYLVKDVFGRAEITEMRRDDVLCRHQGTTVLHIISFPQKLEATDSERDEDV